MKRLAVALVAVELFVVLGASLSIVRAAELDPRGPVTVQLSPVECAGIWSRTQGWQITSDEAGEDLAKFAKACDFEGITAKSDKAAAGKRTLTDADFPGPRAARIVPRDSLDIVAAALSPTREHPVSPVQFAAFKRVRVEFGEVLAGRNPYTPAK